MSKMLKRPNLLQGALLKAGAQAKSNLIKQLPASLQKQQVISLPANSTAAITAALTAAAEAAVASAQPPAPPSPIVNKSLFRSKKGDASVVLGNAVLSLPVGTSNVTSTAQLALTHLYNTYRQSMLIDEIRFFVIPSQINTENGTGSPNRGALATASNLGVRFQMGSVQITREFVHLDALGTAYQDFLAAGYDGLLTNIAVTGVPNTTSFRRWLPPCSILVRPGEVLDCMITKFSPNLTPLILTVLGGTVDVHVTYIGRLIDTAIPEYIDYPYVADFAFTGLPAYQEPDWRQFLNPYDAPLKIQRFIANSYASSVTAPGIVPPGLDGPDTSLTFTMTDSLGYPVLPRYTDVFNFVDPNRRAWTFNRELGPRQHFDFVLRGNNTAPVYNALLAMHCTHTERIQ